MCIRDSKRPPFLLYGKKEEFMHGKNQKNNSSCIKYRETAGSSFHIQGIAPPRSIYALYHKTALFPVHKYEKKLNYFSLIVLCPFRNFISATNQYSLLKFSLIQKFQNIIFVFLRTANQQLDLAVFFQYICADYNLSLIHI